MKKQSILFICAGLVVLVIAGVFVFKDGNQQESQNTKLANTQTEEKPVIVSVSYSKNHTVIPQVTKLIQGQKVLINITSDTADEVHFHGYDLSIELEANKAGEISFTATQTGRFEFELHSTKQTLGIIEVYPK